MSAPIQGSFGQLLRRYRLAAGYSQERLATLSELGVRTIADLECGVSRYPHPHTVEALAQALHLTGATRASFASAARRPGSSASQHQEQTPTTDTGAPVFVGRASELAAGARFLAGDGPSVLLFAGEPGIGKSRLLRELAVQARGAGWRVVAGGCDQRSGREPYAPFVETLDDSLRATPPSRRKGDLKECDWLARLGPELAVKIRTPVPEWSLTPEQEQRMIFAAVRRYLVNIAGPAGTLLILDDLQWAGLDALDLLAFLVRTRAIEPPTDASPHAALRVLGAYRTSEVQSGHPLENLIVDLAHDERLSLYELARLSEGEARLLATGLVDGAPGGEQWITDMVARSDGVPFYLVNYAQAFRPGVEATPLADQSSSLTRELKTPWLVTATIRRRLAALPPEEQETLALAAIIGRVAPLDLLRLARRSSGDEVASSLEVACRARLLEEVGPTVGYRFTHDLIRETVFASLSQARQALLHLAVADTLEQLPLAERARHVAALADHLLQASEPARALPYVLLAGDQAEAVFAHGEAERHFRMAASLAAELGDRAREAEALEKLGGAIHFLGRHVDAADGWQGALRGYQDLHDPLGELRALAGLLLSQAEVGREKLTETVALSRTVLARSEPQDAAGIPPALASALASAYSNLGWILWTSGFHADAQVELRQAVDLARAANNEAELALAQFRLLIAGGLKQTVEAFFETLALAERSGNIAIVVTSHNMAGAMYAQNGDFARALAHHEQAIVAAERHRDLRHLAWQLKNFAIFLFGYGDWQRMRAVFGRADTMMQEADRRYGETWQSPDMPIYRGIFALAEGREEEGRALLEAVIERVAPVTAAEFVLDPTCRLAEADLLAGDAERARRRITSFLNDPHPDPAECDMGEVRLLLAWAEAMLGEESLAEVRLEALLAGVTPLIRVDVLRVRGILATRQQRWDVATAALDEALERTRTMPFPYAELKALWVYGQLETARGDPAARERFKEALAICDRLGEGLYRKYIERDLAALE